LLWRCDCEAIRFFDFDALFFWGQRPKSILSDDIAQSDADTLREAMQVAEQDAILRAVFFEDDVDVALLVHRSSDGEIVYATRVDVDAAVTDARNVVVDKLLVALRGLEDRTRTPAARLEEIGVLKKPERKVVGGFFPEEGEPAVKKKKKKKKLASNSTTTAKSPKSSMRGLYQIPSAVSGPAATPPSRHTPTSAKTMSFVEAAVWGSLLTSTTSSAPPIRCKAKSKTSPFTPVQII